MTRGTEPLIVILREREREREREKKSTVPSFELRLEIFVISRLHRSDFLKTIIYIHAFSPMRRSFSKFTAIVHALFFFLSFFFFFFFFFSDFPLKKKKKKLATEIFHIFLEEGIRLLSSRFTAFQTPT